MSICLIWVQTVCKGNHQTTLVDKELCEFLQNVKKKFDSGNEARIG